MQIGRCWIEAGRSRAVTEGVGAMAGGAVLGEKLLAGRD